MEEVIGMNEYSDHSLDALIAERPSAGQWLILTRFEGGEIVCMKQVNQVSNLLSN